MILNSDLKKIKPVDQAVALNFRVFVLAVKLFQLINGGCVTIIYIQFFLNMSNPTSTSKDLVKEHNATEKVMRTIKSNEEFWKDLKSTVTRTIKLNDGNQITKTYKIGKPLGKVSSYII